MTQEQIFAFKQRISLYTGTDLTELKKLIDQKIQEEYNLRENFMLHDKLDEYIYIVYFFDETFHYHCIGAEAYEEYIKDSRAVRIARKTKDLFPVYQPLLEKETVYA